MEVDYTSLPHITKLVESTSISGQQGLPSLSTDLTTTSSHNLPGSYLPSSAQTNILFTTLNSPTTTVSSTNKSLSFIETSVPGAAGGRSSWTTLTSTAPRSRPRYSTLCWRTRPATW